MGMINAAAHHSGNIMNPVKKSQAWSGLPPLSSHPREDQRDSSDCTVKGKDNDQGVGCIGLGFRGSRMWKVLRRPIEGACGDIRAEIGIDACERLRLDGALCCCEYDPWPTDVVPG